MTDHLTKEDVISQAVTSRHDDDPVKSVFGTPDLLLDILSPLIDGDFLPTLHSLSTVSKNFHQAVCSKKIWKEMCHQRWKGKWGFHPRWEKALIELEQQQQTWEESTTADNNFWKTRYLFEEKDASRKLIFAEELQSLVFDFRFWIGQPTVVDGRIVVKSGLLRSASQEVRFDTQPVHQSAEEDGNGISRPIWSARGHVTGHPCREPGIEWFLDEQKGTLQWGFMPNLWPQGNVIRLDNWGWQIQNPNVVLRSIDPLPSSTGQRHVTKLDDGEQNNNTQNAISDDLWKDLIESLENVPLRAAPLVNGFTVTADIPRSFIEQYEYE